MSELKEPDTNFLRAELSASEERFRCLFELSPTGVVIVNESGFIQGINSSAVELLHKSKKDLLGKKFDIDRVSGQTNTMDIPASDGSVSTLQTRIVAIDWESTPGFLVSLSDVTEHATAAKALNKVETELRAFADVLAHDIKAPVRNIQSISTWLKEDYAEILDKAALTDLDLLSINATRLHALVHGLLEYMQVGLRKVSRAHVDLNSVMASALACINADIQKKAGTVLVEPLPLVHADADLLEVVFKQILLNSLLYSNTDPEIKVYVKESGPYWQIVFEDNGIGVKSQFLERIFEPLERLHSPSDGSGIGLGLAICRKIIDKHDGHIFIESDVDVGSKVIVQLPIKPDA